MSWREQQLYTMSADGSDVQIVAPQLSGVALSPPVWSPDGQRLAFVVNEGERYPDEHRILYTVRYDGSELVRIGETAVAPALLAAPTWSPYSERLAFVGGNGQETTVHTVRFDGTDLRQAWRGGHDEFPIPISQVSWSPDGSEILFVFSNERDVGGIYAVSLDGNGLRVGCQRFWTVLGPRDWGEEAPGLRVSLTS